MSTNPTGAPGARGAGAPGAPGEPTEEELRAAYEAELSRITSADMMLQAAVSLLNIGSYRLVPRPAAPLAGEAAPQSGRDLEQVRDAIDGVRALLGILERRPSDDLGPLRDALSQLQMAYAREVQSSGGEAQPRAGDPAGGEPQTPPPGGAAGQQGETEPAGEQDTPGPGPAESSGRLWVPGR